MGPGDFVEIFCDAPVEICETRDPKGLYKRARSGEIREFTGISSPYEAPQNSEITVGTGADNLETCARKVIDYLLMRELIATEPTKRFANNDDR